MNDEQGTIVPGTEIDDTMSSLISACSHILVAALAAWLADRDKNPLVVIDSQAKVILQNTAAKRLADASKKISIVSGHIRVGNSNNQSTFKGALAIARLTRSIQTSFPNLAMTARISLLMLEVPACELFSIQFTPRITPVLRRGLLRSKWNLTSAEEEVALLIFNGKSLVQIAKQRNASINTVKTQSRRLFEKCGVNSQVTLVRQITALLYSRELEG